jgi:hypothetical protein
MPQNIAFNLTGSPFFEDTSVSFEVTFENPGDQALVEAYEWYLDSILIINAAGFQFTGQVACGTHSIGVKLLSAGNWTGIQDLSFETCKAISTIYISGPDTVLIGDSEAYNVICEFTDGTTTDVTAEYTFTSTDGGSFSANIFTATGDGSGDASIDVTITADNSSSSPLIKQITVTNPDVNSAGILVVDLFNNSTLNVIGLIDNAEVAYNHVGAHSAMNIIPADAAVASALIVASDFINQSVLNWRFMFNLAKLKTLYPATESFVFYIKGRGSETIAISGAYNLKNEAAIMVLEGDPGSYLPTTTGGSALGDPVDFSGQVVSGANGSYDEADLTTIIKLTFSVADYSITYTNS